MTIPEISVIRHPGMNFVDIEDHIDYKFSKYEDKVKWTKTRSPAVRIGTLTSKFEVTIAVELNGKVEGVITLQPPGWNLGNLTPMVKSNPRLFTPHTSFHKPLQGLGYAPAIYKAYLSKGASFVTYEQTSGAEKLWDKLAAQGFDLVYVERRAVKGGGWENKVVPENVNKRLTIKCLLGKGARLENLVHLP